MVCLSITPATCRPSAVSWIEAIARLRYCLVIAHHLRKNPGGNRLGERRIIISQQLGREHLEGGKLIITDVVLFILGKAVNEECPRSCPKQDDRAKPARLAPARTRYSLLEHIPAKFSTNQPSFNIGNRFAQGRIRTPCFSGEPRKRLVFEYSHMPSSLAPRASHG